MAYLKCVTVLKRDSFIDGVFSNNLAAYNQMIKLIPAHERKDVASYSTVNRYVQQIGDSHLITTTVGHFVIVKLNLFRKSY